MGETPKKIIDEATRDCFARVSEYAEEFHAVHISVPGNMDERLLVDEWWE